MAAYFPSDPYDKLRVQAEIAEFERSIDNRMDDFSTVILSRSEWRLLKKADKTYVGKNILNEKAIDRLRSLSFIRKVMKEPDPQDGIEYYLTRPRGHNYILYYRNQRYIASSGFIREILLLIIGGLIAVFIEHFPDIYARFLNFH